MKKILSKIKNRISNSGSGIVLVIVALGFVGILAGALLTAVGYAYRLKLYDYNARSNFYYLEQSMDEIYSGVGAQTMTAMQEAFEETKEQAVYYDISQGVYKNIGNAKANSLFKDRFMNKMNPSTTDSSNWFYLSVPASDSDNLVKNLNKMISNSTVTLDYSDMKLVKETEAGIIKKVIIKNVRLKRTAEYSRSQANGTFEQTIQTDIEIARPDFDVNFDSNNVDADNLFKYCMIADSGVEINESAGSSLTINGNVYAASDFYNKLYNLYDGNSNLSETQMNHFNSLGVITKNVTVDENTIPRKYEMNKVSNYDYNNADNNDLYNHNKASMLSTESTSVGNTAATAYDGYNFNSKYSGFFVNGSNVNFIGDYLVVPGSISVMNAGVLNVYGYSNSEVTPANVWTDEIVLAGDTKTISDDKKVGSKASFNANLYVKDDTQIESDYSEFSLSGGYYGYSNSSTSDNRVFIPTTKRNVNDARTNIYQEQIGDTVENRGHYNSSSIIVNGQHSKIDLSKVEVIYIAGRSYIEMSQQKTGNRVYNTLIKDDKDNFISFTSNDYEYDSTTHDYKTGESMSIRSNQVAYKPYGSPKKLRLKKNDSATGANLLWTDYNGQKYSDAGTLQDSQCDLILYWCDVPATLQDFYLFQKYFGYDSTGENKSNVTRIPVICKTEQVTVQGQTTKKQKTMYYIDFTYAANYKTYMHDNDLLPIRVDENVADALSRQFIKDYSDYIKYYDAYNANDSSEESLYAYSNTDTNLFEDSTSHVDELNNIVQFEDFQAGQVALSNGITDTSISTVKSYTSGSLSKSGNGLITSKKDEDVKFDVVLSKYSNLDNSSLLLGSDSNTSNVSNAQDFSKDFQKHYNYVKWSLQDMNPNNVGSTGIDTDVEVADKIIADEIKDIGEASITPINKFMNFNLIYSGGSAGGDPYLATATNNNVATNINPSNLDLGDYKVWVSNDDVTVEASANDNNEVTGIVITKGDVYFKNDNSEKSVHRFNGIIISGGKIYLNNDLCTNISSSELCRNIISSCLVKAKNANSTDAAEKAEAVRACRVLTLFKEYEDYGKAAYNSTYVSNSSDAKDINMIDYSDVLRYNNWMRNVD